MEEHSRTKKYIFNMSSTFVVYITKTILSFIARTIFIYILGELYLGVNGLLTNILSMMSLAELGISSAISFSLYKPLAEKNHEQISALMTFFRKVYNIIGGIIFVLGIIVFFFLDKIIPEYNQIENIAIIYFLYLINTVSTYYVAYKEILITADQKSYKLTKINLVFTVLLYLAQIIILLVFKNFVMYLIGQFFIQIMQKIFTNRLVTKEYKEITYNTKAKIEETTFLEIKKNVKAMVFHKVGEYCIYGTDNIIISAFINVITVGIYSNYMTIVNMINSAITMIYNNLTASFGNLLVEGNRKKSLHIFYEIDLLAYLLYGICGVILASVSSKFVNIWLGGKYLLENMTVLLISFNFFFNGTRVASTVVRNAAGLYAKDKYVPIIQALLNLIISIVGAIFWGINGVILGTIISSVIPCFYRSFILFKYIFKESYLEYLKKFYIKYLIIFFIVMILSNITSNHIHTNEILGLIITTTIAILIFLISIILFFGRTEQFKYLINIIKNIISKIIYKLGRKKNG